MKILAILVLIVFFGSFVYSMNQSGKSKPIVIPSYYIEGKGYMPAISGIEPQKPEKMNNITAQSGGGGGGTTLGAAVNNNK